MRSHAHHTLNHVSSLGGVVVSAPTTGPKGRGFKPCRGEIFLRAIKLRRTPSLGRESKAGGRMSLRFCGMLKIRWCIFDTDTQSSHSVHYSYLLPVDSDGSTARMLWWTGQGVSPAGIINTMALHAHTTPEGWTIGPLVAAVLRSKSCPIDIINQIMLLPFLRKADPSGRSV